MHACTIDTGAQKVMNSPHALSTDTIQLMYKVG